MPKRTAPNAIKEIEDLSQLASIVQDKRNSQRSNAKKARRNRHYEKQLLRNAMTTGVLRADQLVPDDD